MKDGAVRRSYREQKLVAGLFPPESANVGVVAKEIRPRRPASHLQCISLPREVDVCPRPPCPAMNANGAMAV